VTLVMTGRLRFYDAATAWGVIVADEGGLYMLYGQPVTGAPLRDGERVRFEAAAGPGGPRAIGVQRLSPFTKWPPSAAR
jgi:cold shock CspA family protein